jgi:hypothetical protein
MALGSALEEMRSKLSSVGIGSGWDKLESIKNVEFMCRNILNMSSSDEGKYFWLRMPTICSLK